MREADADLITINRGRNITRNNEIAVIFISTNSDPLTRQAVQSIKSNHFTCEIIVVNTGKGSLKPSLRDVLDDITLIECRQRKFAGGARNLGIQEATSKIISFLAADCLATPDWISNRLLAHESGPLVPSTIYPSSQSNGRISRTSWASYFVTHFERIPGMPTHLAKPFSLSYDRSIFDNYGMFDPALRTGEDSEFNSRIPEYQNLSTNTAVVTLHAYPENLFKAIRIQYKRGVHEYMFANAHYGRSRIIVAGRSLKRIGKALFFVIGSSAECCRQIRRSMHIVAPLIVARIIGNLSPKGRK